MRYDLTDLEWVLSNRFFPKVVEAASRATTAAPFNGIFFSACPYSFSRIKSSISKFRFFALNTSLPPSEFHRAARRCDLHRAVSRRARLDLMHEVRCDLGKAADAE